MRFEVEKIRCRKEGLAAGRAKAIAEGKAEAIAEGKAEAIAKGKAEAKAEIVLGMLEDNWSLELIAKYTKLTVEQIIEIGRAHGLI